MNTNDLQTNLVGMIRLANLWKSRARAAMELARYLNSLHSYDGPFMHDEDLKREVESRGQTLLRELEEKMGMHSAGPRRPRHVPNRQAS